VSGLTAAELPEPFVRAASRHRADPADPAAIDGQAWVRRLPRLASQGLDRWRLVRDRSLPLRWGVTALVLPVLRPEGDPGVLKLTWPHPESRHEHLALRTWEGRGAVRLLAADPATGTLLLERLAATRDLTHGSVQDTTRTLGELLSLLDRPAPPWARPLSQELKVLEEDVRTALDDPGSDRRFPRRMLQQAAALCRDLRQEPDLDARLVHSDLHQLNVLWRPEPGAWVAIDPKPVAGDPHWALAPALWNRWPDALAAHDLGGHLRNRLQILCDTAGLEPDRARAMTILRLVRNALWAIGEGPGAGATDLTGAVTIIKAMQHH
jgi:streptomycin 6-kinase